MLARTYKTHEQLKIRDWEYDALFKVKARLENDTIQYADLAGYCPATGMPRFVHPQNGTTFFNMGTAGTWEQYHRCGTVACIGGWVAIMAGEERVPRMEDYVKFAGFLWTDARVVEKRGASDALQALYFPPSDVMSDITTKQAAQAIDNFLQFGSPRWEEIVSCA